MSKNKRKRNKYKDILYTLFAISLVVLCFMVVLRFPLWYGQIKDKSRVGKFKVQDLTNENTINVTDLTDDDKFSILCGENSKVNVLSVSGNVNKNVSYEYNNRNNISVSTEEYSDDIEIEVEDVSDSSNIYEIDRTEIYNRLKNVVFGSPSAQSFFPTEIINYDEDNLREIVYLSTFNEKNPMNICYLWVVRIQNGDEECLVIFDDITDKVYGFFWRGSYSEIKNDIFNLFLDDKIGICDYFLEQVNNYYNENTFSNYALYDSIEGYDEYYSIDGSTYKEGKINDYFGVVISYFVDGSDDKAVYMLGNKISDDEYEFGFSCGENIYRYVMDFEWNN